MENNGYKFCSNCGNRLPADAVFCDQCGTKVPTVQANPNIPQGTGNINNQFTPQQSIQYANEGTGVYVQKKKKAPKKGIVITAVVLVLIILFSSISRLGSSSNSPSSGMPNYSAGADSVYINEAYNGSGADTNKDYTHTVMIYMCGSNLESEGGCATADMGEIINSKIDTNKNNILICTGGASVWHNDFVSSDDIGIYRLNGTSFEKLESYNSTDFCSPECLASFLQYGYANYNTDYYSLILWDHGGGPIWGYGSDELNDDNFISIYEIATAIKTVQESSGKKLEFLGFDACLMASVEIASMLAPYANYYIASEETEPGTGWNYAFMSALNSSGVNGAEIGKEIVKAYADSVDALDCDATLSCFDLNKFSTFESEFDEAFAGISNFEGSKFNTLARARSNTKSIASFSTQMSYDLVDINDMFNNLSADINSSSCISALDDLTVARYTNVPSTCGMSIYYPNNDLSNAEIILEQIYPYISFSTSYNDYINNYYKCKIGGKSGTSRSNIPKSQVTSDLSKDSCDFTLTLTDEQLADFSYAKYVVVRKVTAEDFSGLGDDTYNFVFGSNDVELSGNTIKASYNNKSLFLKDIDGKLTNHPVLSLETEICNDGNIRYHLFGTIGSHDINRRSIAVRIQAIVNENDDKAQVLQAIPISGDDDNHTANKQLINLADYDYFEAMGMCNKITRDENGNLLPFFDWEASGTLLGVGADYKNGDLQIVQAPIDKDKNDYYCIFHIYDVYGNVTVSELIPFSD